MHGVLAGDTVTIGPDDEVEICCAGRRDGTDRSEAFVYTGRSLIDRQLTGVTRAAKGTGRQPSVSDDAVDSARRNPRQRPTRPPVDNYPVFDTAASDNETWV